MLQHGHEVKVTARQKDVVNELLQAYGIDYIQVGKAGRSKTSLPIEWLAREIKLLSIARDFLPDIVLGIHNPAVAHVAKLVGAKSIIFTDTEYSFLSNLLTFPSADVVCTPECYKRNLGKKHVRYNGYHELAYLHPDFFQPDPTVLDRTGIKAGEKFTLVRFVSWRAIHDIGKKGLDINNKKTLIDQLGEWGKVVICSERPFHGYWGFDDQPKPEDIHHLLHYASLYVGDGATMANEAAILGTPAIYISSFKQEFGNMEELRNEFKTLFPLKTYREVENKVIELLKTNAKTKTNTTKLNSSKRKRVNVTNFITDFVYHYPKTLRYLCD